MALHGLCHALHYAILAIRAHVVAALESCFLNIVAIIFLCEWSVPLMEFADQGDFFFIYLSGLHQIFVGIFSLLSC
ncbi:hypothetical protein CQ12_11300 [Bradyrhizobium jicamae]|uniref:Uncharacterized protein n=1 Tax=Bradyrhizobium jicamae TaxID=280332 RepID=A0A0R3M3U0_9BRAD|nr:hypothetical protein CQ12_11300 [Bradyrhizobium jicamae]